MPRCGAILLVLLAAATLSCSEKKSTGQAGGPLYAVLHTTMGDIKCLLFEKERPVTVKNFADLSLGRKEWMIPGSESWTKKPLYEGTIFHRVIPDFLIQGGDPMGNGGGGPGFVFKEEREPPIKFDRPGRMAMAVSGFTNKDGSQFFITAKATPELDAMKKTKYTVFGECGNLDVVQAISRVERDKNERPKTAVYLKKVSICRGENPCVEEK